MQHDAESYSSAAPTLWFLLFFALGMPIGWLLGAIVCYFLGLL